MKEDYNTIMSIIDTTSVVETLLSKIEESVLTATPEQMAYLGDALMKLDINNTNHEYTSNKFYGTPTAPTAPLGNNTNQIATTEFVNANSISKTGGAMTGDLSILEVIEGVNIVTNPYSPNENIDLSSGGIFYNIANATNNTVFNFRADANTTLNTFLKVGKSITFSIMLTCGASAYIPTIFTIDGITIVPKWLGGAMPSGDALSINVYTFTIIKTANSTYTLLASKSKFA